MSEDPPYKHTQRAPLCLLLYAIGVLFLVLGWVLRKEPVVQWMFPVVSLLVVILATSFHHFTVEDEGDRLSVSFGPTPLFRRTVLYPIIVSVETGRTTFLDGWGVHISLRGGWVWNLWGRDCVVLNLSKGILRIGTDDAERLAEYVKSRLHEFHRSRDDSA
jgi:hypothetical protein